MQTQTHALTFTDTEVRKQFVTWDRGEAEREWACLSLLAEHAPGVAPRPLRREVVDGAPVVVMQRLPGRPLGEAPLTTEQTRSLARALRQLYAVPLEAVRAAGITERWCGPRTLPGQVAGWLTGPHDLAECRDAALVSEAAAAALAWLGSPGELPEPDLRVLGIAG